MGVILRVFEYSRAHAAPATVSSTAGLAPGASRQAPHPSLRLAVGGDEVSIIAGALPTLVVEAWGLYRGAVEALQVRVEVLSLMWFSLI